MTEAILTGFVELGNVFADSGELLRGRHGVGSGLGGDSAGELALETGYADHEKFVEIGADDGEKFEALDERILLVLRFIENARLKGEEAELAVDVEGGIIERGSLRRGVIVAGRGIGAALAAGETGSIFRGGGLAGGHSDD